MNVRRQGVLYSFSIINIFHDKMDLGLFYFHVMKCTLNLNFVKIVFYLLGNISDASYCEYKPL